MRQTLSHYIMLVRRWAWMVALGIVICGGATYGATRFMAPAYQASATIIINLNTSTSPYENQTASQLAVPTFAQLLTSTQVLQPVVDQHPGMTIKQLAGMITVKPQPNTQLIELDVTSGNPQLATDLANQIGQSFEQFTSSQFSSGVQVLPAVYPKDPISPKPLLDSAIGALVGMALAITLIILFEWAEDRLVSIDELHALLHLEVLTVLPQFKRSQRAKTAAEMPILQEAYRMLCARLNLAQQTKPVKLLMVTSAGAGEGKSTVSANLARALAIAGKKVLLVEADLRLPTLSRHFQLEKRLGFSSALMEPWTQLDVKLQGQPTQVPGLTVLAAEFPLQNSADLLQSPQIKTIFEYFQRAPYDYIVFDTPPLLAVADTQILASYISATLLVVDSSKSSRRALTRAKNVLTQTHTHILGIVVNKSQWLSHGYVSHYLSSTQNQPDIDTTPTMLMPRVDIPASPVRLDHSTAVKVSPLPQQFTEDGQRQGQQNGAWPAHSEQRQRNGR